MLSVIFFLLKIIGLILKIIGIILLIILLILALLAFVPIRYRFAAFVPEQKKESSIDVKINWFWLLLVVKGSYCEGKVEYLVKIFGHQIMGNQPDFLKAQEEKKRKKKQKKRKKKAKKKKTGKKQEKPVEKTEEIKKSEEEIPEEKEEDVKELPEKTNQVEKPKPVKNEKPPQEFDEDDFEDWDEEDDEEEETSGESGGILARVKDIRRKIQEIWEEYHLKDNIPFAKDILWRTFRHIAPRKLKGHLTVGLDNPELEGYLTAGMAMLYPVYGRHFSFTPDFQETKLLADCEGRGRIRLSFVIYIVVRLLLNKDIRSWIFG